MLNFIGCISAFLLGLLLSKVDAIGNREAKILTILGWLIALYFAKASG